MLTLLKKLRNGDFLSGHPQVVEFDMSTHLPAVEALMEHEEWPFVRQDVEVSHAQPLSTSRVAYKKGKLAGFFTTHHFGAIGYLDMMIIHPDFRRAGIARPLYFQTVRAMRRKGLTSLVVHTTNDSARLIRLLGFRPGQSFTLLVRPANGAPAHPIGDAVESVSDESEIVAFDSGVFGMERPPWIAALLRQGEARFLGRRENGRLTALLCLRQRKNDALCLDSVMGEPFAMRKLVESVVAQQACQLECFARTDSDLHRTLSASGFVVPDFFTAIGPLVEWRQGPVPATVGMSPRLHSLAWL